MNYFFWANWWNSLIFNMLIWPMWLLDTKIKSTIGINLFFVCWYNFMKINLQGLRIGIVKNGCGQSCDRTLKLTVSEEWTDRINWFFAYWYRLTKIKSWLNYFWVGIVKNGCGQSGYRTLKLAVSRILVFWMVIQIQKS